MVILLHSRTSAAFLAADLKQARVDAVTAAANQAFVQRIPVPSWASVRLLLFTAHSTHTDRVGFEPTVPLRAHRFSRPAVSTAHAPVLQARRLGSAMDRVGFEPTKRLPVYTLSRRVPSAARPPIQNTRRLDAQTPRRLGRMGWDSNPRCPCGHTGFRDRLLQPLGHPSKILDA